MHDSGHTASKSSIAERGQENAPPVLDPFGEHLDRLNKLALSLLAEIDYVTGRRKELGPALPLPNRDESASDSLIRRRSSDPLSAEGLRRYAEAEYHRRRVREKFLPKEFLEEPVWDILLDLYRQPDHKMGLRTTALCIGSNVPATTALRYLSVLEDVGLIVSAQDVRDKRARSIHLSPKGFAQVSAALSAMVKDSLLFR